MKRDGENTSVPWIDVEGALKNDGHDCQSGTSGFPWSGGYFGGNLDFPGTSFEYNGNLRWLICYYKKLAPSIQNIIAAIKQLQDLYDTIPDEISQAVVDAMRDVYNILTDFGERIDEIKEYTETEILSMKRILDAWAEAVTKLESYVDTVLPAAKAYADSKDAYWVDYIKLYVDKIAKVWPPVKDPSDGKLEDINTVLQHIYEGLGYHLTYGQFNDLNLTYGMFNGALITYGDFNIHMDKMLDKYDQNTYMFSPFNGEYVKITSVIWDLYRLHYPGSTYEWFDKLALTYGEFDVLAKTYGDLNSGSLK